MNTILPLDCYYAIFLLDPDERASFLELFSNDEDLGTTIDQSAEYWRTSLLPEHEDPIICRQRFILKTLLQMAKLDPKMNLSKSLCQAIAFAMADLVEQKVNESETSKINSRWK